MTSGLALAAAAARRFYVDGQTKVEIARQLGVSRFKVARLLTTAHEAGLVRIEVAAPSSVDAELSDALRSRFGLRSAFAVVPDGETPPARREAVAAFTAGLLEEVLVPEDVVGIAWGAMLTKLAGVVQAPLRCRFVQLNGALPRPDVHESAVDLVNRIAVATASSAATYYAPMSVPDAVTADGVRAQTGIAEVLAEHDSLTRAVLAVGAWRPGESTLHDSLAEEDRSALAAAGVVAEVTGVLLDADGRVVPHLAERVIGITAERLGRVPEVLAMASGDARDAAAAAALRSGLVSTAVLDTSLARRVLRLPPR